MDTKDKLIEKLKEIFKYLNDRANTVTLNWSYYVDLRNEITALEKQVEEQESKPIYDEAYLQECIKKATPRLSKIKDVDKELDEIRGIEEQKSEECEHPFKLVRRVQVGAISCTNSNLNSYDNICSKCGKNL